MIRLGLIFLVLAGCTAPRVIWAGRDLTRVTSLEVLAGGAEQWVRSGDTQGPHFDAIGTEGIAFSREGGRAVCPAVRGGKWFVVTGDQTLGPWDGIADLRISGDGARVAFAAQLGPGWRPVVDGVPGPVFEHVQGGTLQFSENGAHVAFVASNGPCAYLVVDDIPGPCLERVLSLRATNAGTVAAMIREHGQERFVIQPQPQPAGATPPADALGEWSVTSDGRRFVYAARQGARWSAVLDGVLSPSCGRVQYLRFGDSGRRVAWVCVDGGQSTMVIDGVAGKPFLALSAPVLSARSNRFAYVGHDGLGEWVVTDDAMSGPFADVRELSVPRAGGPVAFVARADGVPRVVHGDQQTIFPMLVDGSLVVSEDGGHWAVIAGDPRVRELWLIVDGERVRKVTAPEVFDEDDAQLGPWLERELKQALSAKLAASNGRAR